MKVFVWITPFEVSYGDSIAYAVAEDEDSARKQIRASKHFSYGIYDEGTHTGPLDIDRPPDRVHDLPWAEIYSWSE